MILVLESTIIECLIYLCRPDLWGKWGHLDLLWFPITWMWVRVRLRLSVLVSAPDFVYAIFPSFSLIAFNFSDNALNWLTFRGLGSNFKVAGGHYVSKLTVFPVMLCWWLSQFRHLVSIAKTFNCDLASIFKVIGIVMFQNY